MRCCCGARRCHAVPVRSLTAWDRHVRNFPEVLGKYPCKVVFNIETEKHNPSCWYFKFCLAKPDRHNSRRCARRMGDVGCGRGVKPSPGAGSSQSADPGRLWSRGACVLFSCYHFCEQRRKPASGVLKFCDGCDMMSHSFPGGFLIPQGVPGRTGIHRVRA